MQPVLLISLLLTLSSIIQPSASQQSCNTTSSVRAGYWLSQSNHYSPLSLINTSLYTHLYYSSLAAAPSTQLETFSTALKSSNPSLKTLLSVSDDSSALSSMAADPFLRAAFINSTIASARAHAFDGVDLAWQFPSSSADMANLALLLTEWRARIDEQTPPLLLLTATVYFSNHLFDRPTDDVYYPIDAISSNLDWANALCFGYPNYDDTTAAASALYDKVSHYSTSYGITSWLDAGVPPCKLVMGIPLYGRSWVLKNKAKNGVGAPVVASGPRQRLSNRTGEMAYFEIEGVLNDNTGVVPLIDNSTGSAYFHTGGVWVSYDSTEVVEMKIEFARRNSLRGYFLWPISFDDTNYTVSKHASDFWLSEQMGSELEDDENGYLLEAPSPPRDAAATKSAAIASFRRGSGNLQLHSCINLLFLLSYMAT